MLVMTILVTGGAGFIGFSLAKRLAEVDQVIIFDKSIDRIKDEKEENMILIKGDIANLEELEKICTDHSVETIFHLAAILPPLTEEDPYLAFKVNVEGTLNILKIAGKCDVETIIYPSSATVFGPDRMPPFTEEDLTNPWTVYSAFKVCSEILGSVFSRKKNISFRAVRLPVVIGPGRDRMLGMTKYPVEMVEDSVKGRPYTVEVDPETKVPIIYIDDAVQVLINLWRLKEDAFEIYNIDGLWVTARELAEGVKKVVPTAEIKFKPSKDEMLEKAVSDVKERKEESKFSFRSKRLLDEILQEYVSRLPNTDED